MILNQSIETNYFSVFYNEADCNIIEQIVTLIDNTYDNTVKRFELKKTIKNSNLCYVRVENHIRN